MMPSAPAIEPRLARREQRHRRRVLLGLATLLVLSISPVIGHHLIGGVVWLPATQEHLGAFCLVALHHLLAPVHDASHLLLLAGISYAVLDRGRALWRQAAVLRAADSAAAPTDSPLALAARRVGLAPARLRLLPGSPNPAFTIGWWHPRVYVAGDLPVRLTIDELEAVLAHEAAHVRRRDPLRLFVLRALADVLFWLHAMRRLADDLTDEAEIEADDAAARIHALPLASAILRLARGAGEVAGVGFQRADLFERRIRRLAGEDATVGTHVSRRSLAAATLALLAVWVSGIIVLHPLPAPGATGASSRHCDHPGEWSLSHLFCRGEAGVGAMADCPHGSLPPAPLSQT